MARTKTKPTPNKPYVCKYCNHGYTRESTLATHVCEQKRRHLQKNDKAPMIGYQTYVRFYQLTQDSSVTKSYDEFAKSPYYNAFVKFGSFVSNTNPLYPDKFIDYVVKSGVKLDHWCRDSLYEKYVLELILTESAHTALERSIKHMQAWAETKDSVWNDYFRYVSPNRVIFDIKDGKVSPWLILNSPTGKQMLNTLSDDQLDAIANVINPQVWVRKFKSNAFDLQLIKDVVTQGNL